MNLSNIAVKKQRNQKDFVMNKKYNNLNFEVIFSFIENDGEPIHKSTEAHILIESLWLQL